MFCLHKYIEKERVTYQDTILSWAERTRCFKVSGVDRNDCPKHLSIIQECVKCGKLTNIEVY